MDLDQALSNIRIDNLNWYNFYNLDIDPDIYFTTKYYRDHKYDNIEVDQEIKTCFLDIEVWHDDKTKPFDFKSGVFPISAITIAMDGNYFAYITLWDINKNLFGVDETMNAIDFQKKTEIIASEYKKYFIDNKYMDGEEEITVYVFIDELSMIKSCWAKIAELGPVVLSGWNSDSFDFPYIYNRLNILTDKKTTNSIMSELGFVTYRSGLIHIPDYTIFDLLHAYKPRAEGGLNYGKPRASYSLNFISEIELKGLKKIEYKGEYGDLNQLFEQNPKMYLLYNIADVILCDKLDKQLKHIELHNGVRRRVNSSFSKATIGSSALYENFVFGEMLGKSKVIRNGITQERLRTFDKEDFDRIPMPILKKKQIAPGSIIQKDYSAIVNKFDGAYVTTSTPRILKHRKLIIDLDAESLYPSMMLQSNISFDSYRARIIPTTTYKLIGFLNTALGSQSEPPSALFQNIFELVESFISNSDLTPKGRLIRDYYYIISYLVTKIFNSSIPLKNIFKPSNNLERILLQAYLIPLLDIMNTIHPDREAYNDFMYEYMFNGDISKFKDIYIIEDISSSNMKVSRYTPNETVSFINKYSTTMAGTCFTKHKDGLGLFTEFLQNMGELRKDYRRKASEHKKGHTQFQFYNNRQLSIKVLMNSTYGIYGLSSFRYSNHWLAHSITTQGRTIIKVAQHLTEKYLTQMNSN